MRQHIRENFGDFYWENVKMENLCGYAGPEQTGGADVIQYTPTQDFIRHYFTPQNPLKGLLLWSSVGTGKTCSAIAAATSTFEPQGYTILWVTRTTLKNDIWKNMFEQVCNERIRIAIQNGEKIPDEHAKRMRMLSKSWSIRPMSYKQFSNLVSKQNNFYTQLVKKNGEIDPLRKTLLIIDEAHKLYGGTDLSSLERPDMGALHASIMNSYMVSGHNSVKLLLMTATPITNSPMELIKLLNLCRLPTQQLPTDFNTFSDIYLNEDGEFTPAGKDKYLDDIAGYVSYLNREKDARQFAQPIIKPMLIPIADKKIKEEISMLDKREVHAIMNSEVADLKEKIKQTNKKLEGDLGELSAKKFGFLLNKCDEYEGKASTKCKKIVRGHIRELLLEAKKHTTEIKDEIKDLRERIKNANLYKSTQLKSISDNITDNEARYARYQQTMFYNLKNTCGKKIKNESELREVIKTHPAVLEIESKIEAEDTRIREMHELLEAKLVAYKNRIKSIKQQLKDENLNDLEQRVLRMIMKEQQRDLRKESVNGKKTIVGNTTEIKKIKKSLEKTRKIYMGKVRKVLRKTMKEDMKVIRENEKAAKKLRKQQIQQGEIQDDIKNENIRVLVDKYSEMIDNDMKNLHEELVNIARKEEEKKMVKENAKQERIAKRAEQAEKKAALRAEQAAKKAASAERRKTQKAQEAAKKAASAERRKTQKAQDATRKAEVKALEAARKAASAERRKTQKAQDAARKAEEKAAAKLAKQSKPAKPAKPAKRTKKVMPEQIV
jgi:hypothetical protein